MQGVFLGGAREVGRLSLALGNGPSRLLLDHGLAPEDPPRYPNPAPSVSAALATHAHLDHVGMLPVPAHEHGVPIYGSQTTLSVADLLCRDCLKVHRLEGYGQPYPPHAIDALAANSHPTRYHHPFDVDGWRIQPENSGHLPGSTMYRLQHGSSVLFTADLDTRGSRMLEGAEPVGCDTLILEGTYAGREHPPREETEQAFLDAVRSTVEQGGVCIIPAFATGRTQELLLVLDALNVPVYLDGMGQRVTELFLKHPRELTHADTLKKVYNQAQRVRGHHQRQNACQPGSVILTTSGMLEGGPVLSYLEWMHDDPTSSVLLTGYQVEGTNGRRLLDTGKVKLDDRMATVNARVERFDFSGHAGHSELVAFAEGCSPETIVVCHSDEPEPLIADLETVADRVIAPHNGEMFEIP